MTKLALVSVIVAFLVTPAHAQSEEVVRLIQRETIVNDICRGTDPGAEQKAACCERSKVGVRLNKLGWCYGKRNEIGANNKWHRCTRNSQRVTAGC